MMREMKDHELDLVVGGRSDSGDETATPTVSTLKTDITTHLTAQMRPGSANAGPFLLVPGFIQGQKNAYIRSPRNLPGTNKHQSQKAGPHTCKTPYLNR